MSKKNLFNERYKTGDTPWELNAPDKNLIHFIQHNKLGPFKALDIGCGTGSNAIWLAKQGFNVTGSDFSSLAIEEAKTKTLKSGLNINFFVTDFLKDHVGAADFEFLFDRGCFHSFDLEEDRKRFANNAHAHLIKNGIWLSFIGNADEIRKKGEHGPPQRKASDIVNAVEPFFEILSLVSGFFDSKRENPSRNWICAMKKRAL